LEKTYNSELTREEMDKIEKLTNEVGKYGSIEIIKNGNTIDVIKSERIRIRNGLYHKG